MKIEDMNESNIQSYIDRHITIQKKKRIDMGKYLLHMNSLRKL